MNKIIKNTISATGLALAFCLGGFAPITFASTPEKLETQTEEIVVTETAKAIAAITNTPEPLLEELYSTNAEDLLPKIAEIEEILSQTPVEVEPTPIPTEMPGDTNPNLPPGSGDMPQTMPENTDYMPKPMKKKKDWYLGISGGWQNREQVSEANDPDTFLIFRSGYGLNAALGRRFGDVRLETEFSFFNNDIATASAAIPKQFGIAPAPADGNINLKAYMLNLYYDIPIANSSLKPYLGFGLGLYQSEINGLTAPFFPIAGIPPVNATSDTPFAYQFRAGLGYELSRDAEMYLGYRYFHGNELEFSADGLGTFHPKGASIHNVELGVRAFF